MRTRSWAAAGMRSTTTHALTARRTRRRSARYCTPDPRHCSSYTRRRRGILARGRDQLPGGVLVAPPARRGRACGLGRHLRRHHRAPTARRGDAAPDRGADATAGGFGRRHLRRPLRPRRDPGHSGRLRGGHRRRLHDHHAGRHSDHAAEQLLPPVQRRHPRHREGSGALRRVRRGHRLPRPVGPGRFPVPQRRTLGCRRQHHRRRRARRQLAHRPGPQRRAHSRGDARLRRRDRCRSR